MLNARLFMLLLLLLAGTFAFGQSALQLFNEAKTLQADGKDRKAIKKFEDALEAAKAEKNLQVEMNSHMELAGMQDNVVHYKDALSHYKEFSILYKKLANQKAQVLTEKAKVLTDSVAGLNNDVAAGNVEIVKKNADIKKKESAIDSLTTEHLKTQLANKDLELTNQKNKLELQTSQNRWNILLLILAMTILAAIFVVRGYAVKRKGLRLLEQLHQQIVVEKGKSDDLLLNILPETIADELKEHGKTTPCRFESATVMFTDFKGFTLYSEKHTPEELVKLVDNYFTAFDQIVKKHEIEKIKTIGDAYMCVAGIPVSQKNHASNMIRAAFEFREFVNQEAIRRQKTNEPYLQMRIGVHSGPLVAGVVGSRKFAYDVWGDTVNIAARMEQSGATDNINVSESVYEQVQHEFDFTYRGEIEAKNKGKMKMYFVTGEKQN
jgi:class 3 adenylate cyclase